MVKEYIKKPVKVQGVQYNGSNLQEIGEFVNDAVVRADGILYLLGKFQMSIGDYIIKDANGEFQVYEPSLFKIIFEEQ